MAWAATVASLRRARSRSPGRPGALPRALVYLQQPVALILYGLVLTSLYSSRLMDFPSSLFEWGPMTYGIPALLTGAATALLYHRGMEAAADHAELFSRVLVAAVSVEVIALLGLSAWRSSSGPRLALSRRPS